MFKKIILILILASVCFSVCALDMTEAKPYEENEFPKWALNIRRSEIIFFGAIPVAMPITQLVCDAFKSDLSFWQKLGISAGAAAGIMITDIIIGLVKKSAN